MNKTTFLVLFASIGITALVSTLFGFAGQNIIGTFWGWFWISALLQFIGFVAYNSYLIQRDDVELRKTEIEALEQLSKFTVQLSCAYCQQATAIPIQLNQRNTFKCDGCNQVNGVSMQFMATTLTTPIQSVKLPKIEEQESFEFKVK